MNVTYITVFVLPSVVRCDHSGCGVWRSGCFRPGGLNMAVLYPEAETTVQLRADPSGPETEHPYRERDSGSQVSLS